MAWLSRRALYKEMIRRKSSTLHRFYQRLLAVFTNPDPFLINPCYLIIDPEKDGDITRAWREKRVFRCPGFAISPCFNPDKQGGAESGKNLLSCMSNKKFREPPKCCFEKTRASARETAVLCGSRKTPERKSPAVRGALCADFSGVPETAD